MARRRTRKEAERPVDVHPRAVVVREGDRLLERVESARVHVARLESHHGGPPIAGRERTVERRRVQATLAVGRDGFGCAEAEVPQHQVDRVVPLLPHQYAHPR